MNSETALTSFSFSPTLLWLVVAIVVLIVAVYTIIFLYHWKKYSLKNSMLAKMTVLVYLVGTAGLLLVLLGAAVAVIKIL